MTTERPSILTTGVGRLGWKGGNTLRVMRWRIMPKLTRKYQVTVPKEVRRKLGLTAGSDVSFVVEGERCYLVPNQREPARGPSFLQWLGYLRTGETTAEAMDELRGRETP